MFNTMTIPTSRVCATATNAGEPIVASHPRHPVSQAINRLADSVTGASAATVASAGPADGRSRKARPEGAPKRGLLRRTRQVNP